MYMYKNLFVYVTSILTQDAIERNTSGPMPPVLPLFSSVYEVDAEEVEDEAAGNVIGEGSRTGCQRGARTGREGPPRNIYLSGDTDGKSDLFAVVVWIRRDAVGEGRQHALA